VSFDDPRENFAFFGEKTFKKLAVVIFASYLTLCVRDEVNAISAANFGGIKRSKAALATQACLNMLERWKSFEYFLN